MPNRKLNKATDQRDAMLRNMVTAFLWNGKLVTPNRAQRKFVPLRRSSSPWQCPNIKIPKPSPRRRLKPTTKSKPLEPKSRRLSISPQSSTPAGRSWLTFMTFPSPGSPRKVQRISANAFVKLLTPLLRSSSVSLLPSMTV